MCGLSGLFYLFVKSDSQSSGERQPLLSSEPTTYPELVANEANTQIDNQPQESTFFVDRLSGSHKRVLGTTLSCIAGVLYGFTFTPALYVQDNYPDSSNNALDYVFSLYTGIYLSAIFYFTIYCVLTKNRPKVYPKVILPGLISGYLFIYIP